MMQLHIINIWQSTLLASQTDSRWVARWKSSRQGFLFLNVQRAIKQTRNGVGIFLSTSHSTTAFEVCSCLSLAIVWRCIHLLGLGSSTLAGEGKSTDRRTFPQVFFSTYGIVTTNLAIMQNFNEEILDDPLNLRIPCILFHHCKYHTK